MSLSASAALWRKATDEVIDFSRDVSSFSVQVDQVDQSPKINELPLIDLGGDRSIRSINPPSAWGLTAEEMSDGFARLRRDGAGLPGKSYPVEWSAGVAKLVRSYPPAWTDSRRWSAFSLDAARLLDEHGADLHAHGWVGLNLFGMHAEKPLGRPDCMGLAWLLQGGQISFVGPDVVRIVNTRGVTQTFCRGLRALGAQQALSWDLVTAVWEI